MSALHACLSGSLACSGLSPCPACHAFVQDHVLTCGQVASGQNGAILAFVHDLISALAQHGVGVEVPPIFRTQKAQDEAFLAGCAHGWRQLHMAMSHEEFLTKHGIVITDVSEPEPEKIEPPQAPPEAPPPAPKAPDPTKVDADRARARELARPMDAEEIALAGVAVPEEVELASHAPAAGNGVAS